MAQPTTPHSPATPPQAAPPQAAPPSFSSMPVFSTLSQYIQAAASGSRDSLFHLFLAIFAFARGAVRQLAQHYDAHPRGRTLDTYTRLKYCLDRLQAIFYTLRHAPERFLTPGQLRALTRCRAVLSSLLREPVDFSPLWPYLSSPENCPPPPARSSSGAGSLPASEAPLPAQGSGLRTSDLTGSVPAESGASLRTPHSALRTSDLTGSVPAESGPSLRTPRSALRTSPSDPLLLRSPGCALASVLLQLAALYGISSNPAPTSRPGAPSPTSTPSASPSPCSSTSGAGIGPSSSSPRLDNPQTVLRPPP